VTDHVLMFSSAERDTVRARLLALAQNDPAIAAAPSPDRMRQAVVTGYPAEPDAD